MSEPVTDLETLPLIFDRRRRRHRWLEAFAELEEKDPTRRAVCRNWRMDHRVSQRREEELLDSDELGQGAGGEEWWQRRGEHFGRTICQPTQAGPLGLRSAYLEPANGANSVSRGRIPAHEQLIHLASLNRILWRLTSAEHPAPDLELAFPDLTGHPLPARPIGSGFRDRASFEGRIDEIAEAVNRRGLDAVQRLAGMLCEALGERQPPWWAGFAQEVMPILDRGDGTALCQALGMGHLEEGEWLLVWRYEAGEVYLQDPDVQLYRPTVVEAGDNPFHFSSPPGYPFGITMPLTLERHGSLREVLHPPLRGRLAADACRYELHRIAKGPVVDHNQLLDLRRAHRRRLARDHPQPDTSAWLDRHSNRS